MTTSRVPAYLVSGSGVVTIHMNGHVYTAAPDHSNYKNIVDALKAKRWKKLPDLFNVGKAIEKRSRKVLKVKDGQIFYGDTVVHNVVADRILQFMAQGFDFKPLFNFLRNLMQNPVTESREHLYRFIEANQLTITWDGYVLCYKKVRDDYKDYRTITFDNSPGKVVEMPRENVTADPQEACSSGLHVGGLKYCRDNFQANDGKIVLVKVHPADVVSVPFDYANAKCRVCKYTVIEDFVDYLGGNTERAEAPVTQKDVAERDSWEPPVEDDYCNECGEAMDDCSCDDEVEDDDDEDDYDYPVKA
jgi:hypothetical protein